MNQRRNKKSTRILETRILKPSSTFHVTPDLPKLGKVMKGKSSIILPYVDKIGDIVSLESDKSPITHEKKVNRPSVFVSKVLDCTGFDSLKEIADAIKGEL